MPVDVKGRIVYNPEAEEEYKLDCKQLGIEKEATGTLEDDIEELRQKVTDAIVEEFHVEPAAVQITGYSMSLNFSIEGPINKTLDDFKKEDKE
jgi:poly(3-hydroxybutyrate) depolymerase